MPRLAALDRTFRSLQPAARCAAGADTAARARRLRAAALKNAAKAPPKVVKRKKASMRRAIRLLRRAGDLCEAPPPGGAPPAPGGPAPPPPTPPGTQTVALSTVSSGVGFVPNQAIRVAAGTVRFELSNTGNLYHSIGVRLPPPPGTSQGVSSAAAPGGATRVDIALTTPGAYQIYCDVSDHAANGMVVDLTVTPLAPAPGG